jgi:hypothetical protein
MKYIGWKRFRRLLPSLWSNCFDPSFLEASYGPSLFARAPKCVNCALTCGLSMRRDGRFLGLNYCGALTLPNSESLHAIEKLVSILAMEDILANDWGINTATWVG